MRRKARTSQRRLATVMFIDMVGSTALAAQIGDRRWQERLAEFRQLVRRSLRDVGGREIDNAGDGFFTVFDEPIHALQCAALLNERLNDAGITIRAGVHTGEVEHTAGGLSGIAVHIGARIAAQAEGGQVLVSSTVRDLVSGSDYGFTDAGVRQLKGVPGEWRLYAAIPVDGPARLPAAGRRRALLLGVPASVIVIAGTVVTLLVSGRGPTSSSTVRTIATVATGMAQLLAVTVDSSGRPYVIAGNQIARVNANGTLTTVAGTGVAGYGGDGGPARAGQLNDPQAIAIDSTGNLYIADTGNNRIRLVTPAGVISTFAGTGSAGFGGDGGPATAAQLNAPAGIAIGFNAVLIADSGNNRIRSVALTGVISTIAGTGDSGYAGDGGPAIDALFAHPTCLTVDAEDQLYVADTLNDRVRRITVDGMVTTVAGSGAQTYSGDGGPAADAGLDLATGPLSGGNCLATDSEGDLYIADTLDNRVREVTVPGTIETIAGNGQTSQGAPKGPASAAAIAQPSSVAVALAGDLYITQLDAGRLCRVS